MVLWYRNWSEHQRSRAFSSSDHNSFSEAEATSKRLFSVHFFQDTAMSKVWFKQDDKFFLPKACLNFEFFRCVTNWPKRWIHLHDQRNRRKRLFFINCNWKRGWKICLPLLAVRMMTFFTHQCPSSCCSWSLNWKLKSSPCKKSASEPESWWWIMFRCLYALFDHCHFLYSPFAYVDPLHCNMAYLYLELLKDSLNEYAYAAELAGLNYDLQNTVYGMYVSICSPPPLRCIPDLLPRTLVILTSGHHGSARLRLTANVKPSFWPDWTVLSRRMRRNLSLLSGLLTQSVKNKSQLFYNHPTQTWLVQPLFCLHHPLRSSSVLFLFLLTHLPLNLY